MPRSDGQVLEKLPWIRENKIWYCGEDSKRQYGVAFIVRKEVVGSIISCTFIWNRLLSDRISARSHNITVIRVYAPASDHEDEGAEQVYEQLDNILAKTPKEDTLVGPDAYQHWAGTVGRFSGGKKKHTRNLQRKTDFLDLCYVCVTDQAKVPP